MLCAEARAKEVVRWNFYFVSNKKLSGNKENSCKIPLTRIWLADDVYSDSKVITSAVTSRISQLRPDGPKFRRVEHHTHFFYNNCRNFRTFDTEHLCHRQLKPIKTRYSLTIIMWPFPNSSLELKLKLKLTADGWPRAGFDLIAGVFQPDNLL